MNLFKSVNLIQEEIDDNKINLIIEVEEKQTGTFNAGVSVGTLDGFAIVTGLRERNFYGTGRSLDLLVNTSNDKNQFKLITTDRLSYENDADISYTINYRQDDDYFQPIIGSTCKMRFFVEVGTGGDNWEDEDTLWNQADFFWDRSELTFLLPEIVRQCDNYV